MSNAAMSMKRAIVIYDTKFGNTEKIAKALARGLEEGGVKVDCVRVEEVDVGRLIEYDFLAFGGPTHGFGISKPMKAFLEKLKNVNIKGKKAFAFDTKLKAWWLPGSAGKGIEKTMKEFGMNIAKPHTSAIVKGVEGPLEEGMEEMFEKIGSEIATLI
jgi:flavorubredoxin